MGNDRPGKPPFIHDRGLCETVHIGADTRIWAFAHVLPGARLGANCNICDHVFIENDVVLGDDVTVKCGVQLWDGLRVGDRVFIGPNATFTNDRRPRSKVYSQAFLQTHIEDDVSIGANATILPGLRIGRGAMVGAGAVVTRDVPPYATVVGNPAVVVNYTGIGEAAIEPRATEDVVTDGLGAKAGSRLTLGVRDCFLERLPSGTDVEGDAMPLESGRGLPFAPSSIGFVHGPANARIHGGSACRIGGQFLIASHGALSVMLDDGERRTSIRLDSPTIGLHLAPMVWAARYRMSADAVLTVIASHTKAPDDHIREYQDFISQIGKH